MQRDADNIRRLIGDLCFFFPFKTRLKIDGINLCVGATDRPFGPRLDFYLES